MSTDTMLGNKDRGRVIDWKRVADSYRDDLAAVLLAGNELRRTIRAALPAGVERTEMAVARWDEAVRAATAAEAPICVLSSEATK